MNASEWLHVNTLYKGGISHHFELGGPSKVALDVVPPRGMLFTGSGEGCCCLGQGECSGTGEGEATGADGCLIGEAPCDKVNGWDVGACPHQQVVRSYQHTSEFYRAGLQGSLTGREEVNLTLTFPSDELFFQVLDGLDMSPLGWVSLGGSLGLCIPNGCGANGFGFLDGVGAGGIGFLDGCRAEGLNIQGSMGADGSGFLDGFHCLGIILTKLHAQLPTTFCLQALMDDLVASSSPGALLAFSQGWLASVG